MEVTHKAEAEAESESGLDGNGGQLNTLESQTYRCMYLSTAHPLLWRHLLQSKWPKIGCNQWETCVQMMLEGVRLRVQARLGALGSRFFIGICPSAMESTVHVWVDGSLVSCGAP